MSAEIVNGKKIAKDIISELKKQVSNLKKVPRIDIFICAPNGAIKSFVARKRRTARRIGVNFIEHKLDKSASTGEIQKQIDSIAKDTTGIVVQLPMPEHIDTDKILDNLPMHLDVDVLGSHTFAAFSKGEIAYEPPVAGAVREILERAKVKTGSTKAVMIGKGRLVGEPTIIILKRLGAEVFAIDISTPKDIVAEKIKEADIVVSGTGVANLITPEKIKDGVVLLDAGTSGNKATLSGDISYDCEEKAVLFSRTPGGIGPITVAILFRNLLSSSRIGTSRSCAAKNNSHRTI